MSDAYWRYDDSRQPPAASLLAKRPRSDYDLPSGRDMGGYYSRDDDRLTLHGVRDAESINQSYERYLRSGQVYPGADSSRLLGSGLPSHAVDDPRIGSDPRISSDLRLESDPRISSDPRMTSVRIMDPGMSVKGQVSNLGSGRSEVSLPPDASSTLFVEGLPANCTRREVAHIFRPFVGYKEVRLVTKEARRSRGDPLVLCFVDFLSPPHAATAMDALQVVPALFQHSLKETEEERVTSLDHVFTVEPMKLTSPSTDTEVALALRVLEGCCLIHRQSTILAHQNKAIPVLMNILSSRGVLEQGACLDALIALMLDSTANQMDFETCNGIEEVAAIIRDKQVDENLRMKCGEFLLLLIGHVDARDMQPMATVHDDIRRLLGEKSASLIWAASQFGSTLDPEERMTALHIQARRVLESLDLFGV